jgi:hypothetical protein
LAILRSIFPEVSSANRIASSAFGPSQSPDFQADRIFSKQDNEIFRVLTIASWKAIPLPHAIGVRREIQTRMNRSITHSPEEQN